jgi:cysteine desulfurase
MKNIYLDDNAASPLRPEAREAMMAALGVTGNPASIHGFGRQARRLLEEARETLATCVHTRPETIIFTSNGTEANALALGGLASRVSQICVSAVEHDGVTLGAPKVLPLAVDSTGRVDFEQAEKVLSPLSSPFLCSVIWAHNETGVLNDIPVLAALVKRKGGWFHTDGCQMLGRLPLDFDASGVDMLSLSAHKMGGPGGVGALVVRRGIPLEPIMRGGGQERGMRSGTPSLSLIRGFAAAAQAAVKAMDAAAEKHRKWQEKLEQTLLGAGPEVRVIGKGAPRLPQTTCVTMPGVTSEVQLMGFDVAGLALSAGAACASGKVSASPRLKAMGLGDAMVCTALRVSWGWQTQESDLETFAEAWRSMYDRLANPRKAVNAS